MTRARKYIWWTQGFTIGMFTLLLVFNLLATVGARPWPTVLLGLAAVVVLPQCLRLSTLAMPGIGPERTRAWEIPLTMLVAFGAWWFSATIAPLTMAWSFPPSMLIATLVPTLRGWRRWLLAFGGGAAVALSVFPFAEDPRLWTPPWLIATAVMPPLFGLANLLQVWLWSVLCELDGARAVAAELAVAEERLRFAAELHDIQGHHLEAIALKGELAERLVGHDDDAARAQAAEVSELARTALRETRAVVHGYRRTSLSTEIGNAVDILRAAGISATVTGAATDVPPPLQPLFGALVREGTTNVLRHSAATECALAIRVADRRVRVDLRNDGARDDRASRDGSGLTGLRERFAAVGGTVRAELVDGAFRLTGEAVAP
ncbi:two-component system sensor histidine kinase DesK [Actinokineospora auranticolor]|uniref:Two-component system sensor histidine kinase DesK n=2 Tax=Actinokineospora auranticolor TaxID=155976 RepID=A0A2S6GN72_9PSEU|nr:two-component system sensor histidine kinase DesK [Actinokineospora auranticolor]